MVNVTLRKIGEFLEINLEGKIGEKRISYNRKINVEEFGNGPYPTILENFIVPYFGTNGNTKGINREINKKNVVVDAIYFDGFVAF